MKMNVLVLLCVIGLATADWFGNAQADEGRRRHSKSANTSPRSGRPEVEPCASSRRTCQNFHPDSVKLINRQISEELQASYTYQSMAYYYGRDDVALRGFAKFFQKASDEEREHAQKFMDYLNKRGGEMALVDIPKPAKDEWGTGLEGFTEALALEHHVNERILDLHWVAQQHNDAHLQDFLEGEFLTEQVDSIKQLSDYIAVLKRMQGNPVGEFIFDQELHEGER